MTRYYTTMMIIPAAALMLLLLPPPRLLSAGAAAPSPVLGIPGCETTCGDMDVPYPFGMGPARCYWPGFNLTCDRSISRESPRLLLGDGTLEVVYIPPVYLAYSAQIAVRTPGDIKVDADGRGLLWGGLGDDGPFSLKPYLNELTLTGCNVRVTLKNGNVTMASCSSLCVSRDEPLDTWSCSGEGCCQADVVINREVVAGNKLVGITSYDVELDHLGWNHTLDQKWPARVFVAERGWFGLHKPSQGGPIQTQVPIFLEWEIILAAATAMPDVNASSPECPRDAASKVCRSVHSYCDKGARGGYTCRCKEGYYGNPYVPHGCQDFDECKDPLQIICHGDCTNTMGSFECRCPLGTRGDPHVPGGCFSPLADNCSTWCGNVSVPYPFGIGPDKCYLRGFNLSCDTSQYPPRLLLGNGGFYQVVDISLHNSTVRIIQTSDASFHVGEGTQLSYRVLTAGGEASYSLSTHNELILVGCNVQAVLFGMSGGNSTILSGCSSFCPSNQNDTIGPGGGGNSVNDKYCYGMGCCQSRISMSTDGMPTQLILSPIDQNKVPVLAFPLIAEEGWFDRSKLNVQFLQRQSTSHVLEVPMLLDWEVLKYDGLPAPTSFDLQHRDCPVEIGSGLCKSRNSLCKTRIKGYSCQCINGYNGNPYLINGCKGGGHKFFKGMGAIIGVGAASGASLIFFVLVAFLISKKLKHRRAQIIRRKFFEQNRGQLLQQLVSQRADIAERMIISLEELEKATNNFDKTRELGGGGHGTVYKGILSDLHVVAIKKPKKVVQKEIDEFINEVAILSQINHKNVVKLYGCCLETEVPMLVYEFISNGTLHDHLHVDGLSSLAWDDRLRIAVETAKSIAYLHSTASIPIIHRDIKSVNILLDDALTAKVADFGASRYVPTDKSGLTTMVQGTIGYMDPMYFCTGRLTEKSDVYGFGVILVELLTRRRPFLYLSPEGDGLVAQFSALFAQGKLSQILDPQVTKEGGKEIEEVAAIAVACIKLTGEDRPTMRQVELTLECIQASKQNVLDNGLGEISEEDCTRMSGPITIGLSNIKESSRQYSMEEEFLISSTYPR